MFKVVAIRRHSRCKLVNQYMTGVPTTRKNALLNCDM